MTARVNPKLAYFSIMTSKGLQKDIGLTPKVYQQLTGVKYLNCLSFDPNLPEFVSREIEKGTQKAIKEDNNFLLQKEDNIPSLKSLIEVYGESYLGTMTSALRRYHFGPIIKSGKGPRLVIRRGNAGWGVYALNDIPAGVWLGRYAGVVTIRSQAEREHNRYLMIYPIEQIHHPDLMVVIDAQLEGDYTRMFNHASNPNVSLMPLHFEGLPEVHFVTRCPINHGQELLINYGSRYGWDSLGGFQQLG